MGQMQTIAIVGAGFCGTLAAVHLLREPPPGPTHILLLNRSGTLARGVAYGTNSERHVLNVPAGRMGAFPDAEDDFLRYLRRRDPSIHGSAFVPRQEYGEYLEFLLRDAAERAADHCRFESLVGEVIDIEAPLDGRCRIHLRDSSQAIVADRVVLALGNYLPADPSLEVVCTDFFASSRYVRDPWKADALAAIEPQHPILLVGTGLTMLDVVSDLRHRGALGLITALSRHGFLPQAHRELRSGPPRPAEQAGALLLPSSLRARTRALRDWIRHIEACGGDWRDVIASLRPLTPGLWQSTGSADRARFLRHLKPFWEVHRHRCAPELIRELETLRARVN